MTLVLSLVSLDLLNTSLVSFFVSEGSDFPTFEELTGQGTQCDKFKLAVVGSIHSIFYDVKPFVGLGGNVVEEAAVNGTPAACREGACGEGIRISEVPEDISLSNATAACDPKPQRKRRRKQKPNVESVPTH